MYGLPAGASMLSMPAAAPRPEPMVLVVHTNFAVANALAQRLMESCLVALVSAESALAGNQWHGGYDVVVLCPYLTADERARPPGRVRGAGPGPRRARALATSPRRCGPHLRTASVPATRRSAAEHVFSSLTPTP